MVITFFSPELPIISGIIGLLINNDLTGREMLVLGNFIVNIGHVINLQAQQKLLIKESSRARLNVSEEQYEKDMSNLQKQIDEINWFFKNHNSKFNR